MNDGIVLAPLDEERILQAYPLVREVSPEVAMKAWSDYAHAMLSKLAPMPETQGIVAAWAQNEYLRGLFVYRVLPDIQCGRVLLAEFFVGGSPFRKEIVADALLAGAEKLAREHACDAVHTTLPMQPEWITERLGERGYSEHGSALCRHLRMQAVAR